MHMEVRVWIFFCLRFCFKLLFLSLILFVDFHTECSQIKKRSNSKHRNTHLSCSSPFFLRRHILTEQFTFAHYSYIHNVSIQWNFTMWRRINTHMKTIVCVCICISCAHKWLIRNILLYYSIRLECIDCCKCCHFHSQMQLDQFNRYRFYHCHVENFKSTFEQKTHSYKPNWEKERASNTFIKKKVNKRPAIHTSCDTHSVQLQLI